MATIRRQVKNIVNKYSEAEVKVREATSNDPWGPSTSLMSEISDLTYNVLAFVEIMTMIWKRLNDHGKNWRHVYKALTLLEYLVKTGTARIAQQCKENIFAIQTLKDFQFVDRDGKDQGINVRERAKQLVLLLKDDERLKSEREHALQTKERLARSVTALSSSGARITLNGSGPPANVGRQDIPGPDVVAGNNGATPSASELETARPKNTGEEELQLQLALAMSKEEAERPVLDCEEDVQLQLALNISKEEQNQEERLRRGDDLRLKMALEESQKGGASPSPPATESSLLDLVDIFTAPPATAPGIWLGAPGAPGADCVQTLPKTWGLQPAFPEAPTEPLPSPWAAIGGASVLVAAEPSPWLPTAPPIVQCENQTSGPWAVSPQTPSPPAMTSESEVSGPDPWTAVPASASLPVSFSTEVDPWPFLDSASQPEPAVSDTQPAFDPFGSTSATSEPLVRSMTVSPQTTSSASDVPTQRRSLISNSRTPSPTAFGMTSLSEVLPSTTLTPSARCTPESFLGPAAALVDLDALVSGTQTSVQPVSATASRTNPFLNAGSTSPTTLGNPFGVFPTPALKTSPIMGAPASARNGPGATPVLPGIPTIYNLPPANLPQTKISNNPFLM
uniref:epsin-1-like isoform X1 n=1 Tax=Myxine glutinosa TaxID=7769 RepID=UPI00358E8193